MNIPGADLLGIALGVIGSQQVRYYLNTGREANDSGRLMALFADGVDVPQGSVQAVPRSRYASYGLDFQKSYVTWFVEQTVIDVQRNKSGDRFKWNNRVYECVSVTDWVSQDGWSEVMGVDIGPASQYGSLT